MLRRSNAAIILLGLCCATVLGGLLSLRQRHELGIIVVARSNPDGSGRSVLRDERISELSQRPLDPPSTMEIPHVNKCNYCQKCHISQSNSYGRANGNPSSRKLMAGATPNVVFRPLRIIPLDKSLLPNCTECYGCQHELSYMDSNFRMLNSSFNFDHGVTSAQIFTIVDPADPPLSKSSVVKLWCVSVWNKKKKEVPACKPWSANEAIAVMVSVQNVANECGFRDVISNTWVQAVNGIIPGSGFHVDWDGLWSERATGISVSQVVHEGKPQLSKKVILDIFANRLNKTEIVAAAIFDLLLCQGDRHDGNVFVDEYGHITLIDNDEAFKRAWRPVGVDSVFLPGTQFHKARHVGTDYLRKVPGARPSKYPDASVLLDYRCHAPGGAIGFNYPQSVHVCLEKFSAMSPVELKSAYGLLDIQDATMLHSRATDLLTRGFEWTLEHGEPRNPPALTYRWGTPCCDLELTENGKDIKCADPNYQQDLYRPEGDPKYGDSHLSWPEPEDAADTI